MGDDIGSPGWAHDESPAVPPRDDDLESLLGRRPSRRPWLELAAKQGVAAAVAYGLARLLPTTNGVVIVAPATAATI